MIRYNIHVVVGKTSIFQGQVLAASKPKAIELGRRVFLLKPADEIKATPALG